mgnify:CR=1 FL=1
MTSIQPCGKRCALQQMRHVHSEPIGRMSTQDFTIMDSIRMSVKQQSEKCGVFELALHEHRTLPAHIADIIYDMRICQKCTVTQLDTPQSDIDRVMF